MRTRLWIVGGACAVLLGLAGYAYWSVATAQVETAHAAPLSTIPALVGPIDETWFSGRLSAAFAEDKTCGGCHAAACSLGSGIDHQSVACTGCHGAIPTLAAPSLASSGQTKPSLGEGAGVPSAVDAAGTPAAELAPHPVERSDAFMSPALCHGCHADRADEPHFGKAIVETIEEWRRTPAAAEGRACVACHGQVRPAGVASRNDPTFANTAFTASAKFISNGDRMVGKLALRATDVGHRWPTLASREQVLQIEQVDRGGLGLEGSLREGIVGRRLGADSRELFDTRLMPGEEKTLLYEARLDPDATAMVARVIRYASGSDAPLLLWEQRVELPGAE